MGWCGPTKVNWCFVDQVTCYLMPVSTLQEFASGGLTHSESMEITNDPRFFQDLWEWIPETSRCFKLK